MAKTARALVLQGRTVLHVPEPARGLRLVTENADEVGGRGPRPSSVRPGNGSLKRVGAMKSGVSWCGCVNAYASSNWNSIRSAGSGRRPSGGRSVGAVSRLRQQRPACSSGPARPSGGRLIALLRSDRAPIRGRFARGAPATRAGQPTSTPGKRKPVRRRNGHRSGCSLLPPEQGEV